MKGRTFRRLAAAVRRGYRRHWDFPRNWPARFWKPTDMRRRYWVGADLRPKKNSSK